MTPHPDSCSCGDCIATRATEQVTRIRGRKTRRRRNPIWKDDYRARKFWEACVIQELCSGDIAATVRSADTALVAWRERWETPAEPIKNYGEVHSPDYCPPEEEGGNDYADTRPPINLMEDHRFIPVTGNRYCGECGGGKLHPIHTS